MPRPPSPIPIRRRVVNGCYRRRDELGPFRGMLFVVAAYVAAGLLARAFFVWWP